MKGLLGTSFSTQNFVSSINTGFLLHAAKKVNIKYLLRYSVYGFIELSTQYEKKAHLTGREKNNR